MYSIEHEECEHAEPYCQCIYCSGGNTQCIFAFNLLENQSILDGPVAMDSSGKQRRRETLDNQQLRSQNLNCTETICDSTEFETRRNLSSRLFNIEPQSDRELYPHLQNGTRTPESLRFSFPSPNSRGWRETISLSNEHQQPTNQETIIHQDHRIPFIKLSTKKKPGYNS